MTEPRPSEIIGNQVEQIKIDDNGKENNVQDLVADDEKRRIPRVLGKSDIQKARKSQQPENSMVQLRA